jgi:amylosucrase
MTKASFEERLHGRLDKLKKHYTDFYGIYTQEAAVWFDQLLDVMRSAYEWRGDELIAEDHQNSRWYMSNKLVGMMLYTDLFAGDLNGVVEKIPYLKELGITYLHFMPLLRARDGENDGGYAVADYRSIDPRFGNMDQFRSLVSKLREEGINVCLDYVVNHTAKDHIWAQKALAGDPESQAMYFMYDSDEIPRQFEATVPEVFPKVSPGNFTYYDQMQKWVFTSFYEFQWDLDYHNPRVFQEMIDILLFLANTGVRVIRLDAIPFMWKELGTNCRNLPQVHVLMRMFRQIIDIVCPSVVLKGEAIVEPYEIVKYFGEDKDEECQVLYNAAHMVNIWNSLATRDARLMTLSDKHAYKTPSSACWINYARCHDDIGWGLNEEGLRQLGFDPVGHKQYLINFFKGDHAFSYAKGELYEFNPENMDARNSGSLASLCGLEKAIEAKDDYQRELAIKRILLVHALLLAEAGIPLIYSGDELATINDYSYKNDPSKVHDSRWLHRPFFNWEAAENRNVLGTKEGQVFMQLKKLISIRGSHDIFRADNYAKIIEPYEKAVYSFAKYHDGQVFVFIGNFSEDRQFINPRPFHDNGIYGLKTDLVQGKTVDFNRDNLLLGPFEFVWLVGNT